MRVNSHSSVGIFALVTLTLAVVLSPLGMVIMAQEGLTAHFYYAIVVLFFFVPSAWVFSELASAWPEEGGSYHWATLAFGRMIGNVVLWLRWFSTIVSFPLIITFAAGIVAYIVDPSLGTNHWFVFWVCVGFSIFSTLFSCLGMRVGTWVAAIAAFGSTVIPVVSMIVFAAIWLIQGRPSHTPLLVHSIIPNFHDLSTFSLLGATIYMFGGMEFAAYCLKFSKNPKREYPIAMLISCIIITFCSVLGTLAISILVPLNQTSLIAGMVQALSVFVVAYHLQWYLYFNIIIMAAGWLCVLSSYMTVMSFGFLAGGKDHMLPVFFNKVTARDVPINLVLIQGVFTILISVLFVLVPSVSSAYWMIEAIVAIGGGLFYVLLFAAAIRLRYTHPKTQRLIRIPGGNWGMWLVAGAALLLCLFATGTTFIPPDQFTLSNPFMFVVWLILGTLFMLALPLVIGGICLGRHKKRIAKQHAHVASRT